MFRFITQILSGTPEHANRRTSRTYSPQLEALEGRLVPSTATVDLSTAGAQGTVNGALFQQGSVQPAGSGVIDAFVRIHGLGGAGAEQGYNTDARPLQFDENQSPTFTRSIQLSDIPEVTIGGVAYRVFLLDINQKSSQPLVSLDQLRIFEGDNGSMTGYDPSTGLLSGTIPLYDLNAGGGGANWIELNARLSHGLGSSDMTLDVPDADFLQAATTGNPYVYLFSRFGDNFATNGGFEQWAVQKGTGPAPSSLSGTVTQQGSLASGVMVMLTGMDTSGNTVTLYAVTDNNGFYSFDNLNAGPYTISTVLPSGLTDTASAGTLGGTAGTDVTSIDLGAGLNGLDYDFTVVQQSNRGGA